MLVSNSSKYFFIYYIYTIYYQKYFLTCPASHMNLSAIPFLIGLNMMLVYLLQLPFFLTILLKVHWWSHTLKLVEKAWLSVWALVHPKGVLSGSGQDCAGRSSSSTPDSAIHVFMDLALCTDAQSCWKRKGPIPNCSHKVGSMGLSKMFSYPKAFKVPFTGSRGPSWTPEKPHTIMITCTKFHTWYKTVQMYRSPGNLKPQTSPLGCQVEKRNSSLQRMDSTPL